MGQFFIEHLVVVVVVVVVFVMFVMTSLLTNAFMMQRNEEFHQIHAVPKYSFDYGPPKLRDLIRIGLSDLI